MSEAREHTVLQLVMEPNTLTRYKQKIKINFVDPKSFDFSEGFTALVQKEPLPHSDLLYRLLKDTLTVDSRLVCVACVSPIHSQDTIATLRQAELAQKIPYIAPKPVSVLHSPDVAHIETIIRENHEDRQTLQQMGSQALFQNYLDKEVSLEDELPKFVAKKLERGVKQTQKKLLEQGRCQICTLKIPCKHYKAPPEIALPDLNETSQMQKDNKSVQSRSPFSRRHSPHPVKAKILAYREAKLKKEVEKIQRQQEAQAREALTLRKKEQRLQKYYSQQKRKLEEYRISQLKSNVRSVSTARKKKRRPVCVFPYRANAVREVVRESCAQLEKISRPFSSSRPVRVNEDSLDLIGRRG